MSSQERPLAVDDISLDIPKGEIVGFVGESGSGKSTTALAVMRLLPPPLLCQVRGSILFEERDLLSLSSKEMRKIRGSAISMIFQDPSSSLNPVFCIGDQISEVYRNLEGLGKMDAKQKTLSCLEEVGVDHPSRRYRQFPHELSGGLNQRALIAMALAGHPNFLLADEPTSSLDVTVENKILRLLVSLKESRGLGILLITHDLSLIKDVCSKAVVCYSGQIVEEGPTEELLDCPFHPYTESLISHIPSSKKSLRKEPISKLSPTDGNSIETSGCYYAPLCPHVKKLCRQQRPMLQTYAKNGLRKVRCHFPFG